ncbi:AI-2E family transporter [Roseomonas sp. ACRSG]|nr:AI-2E family transporter [Roseomonas sp. ACRSG]
MPDSPSRQPNANTATASASGISPIAPLGRGAAKVMPPAMPDTRSLTTLAGAVVIVAGLYLGRDVLIPVTLAFLLSLVLSPLIRLLRRARLGRVPSVILAVFIALGVLLSIGGVIGNQLAELADDLPRYQSTISRKLDTLQDMTIGRLNAVVDRAGRDFRHNPPPAAQPTVPSIRPEPSQPAAPLPVEVHQPQPTPLEMMKIYLSPVLSPLAHLGIILIVTIFVLLQREDLRDRLIRLFGSSDLHRTTVAMDDAAYRLSRYFLTQVAINAAFGCTIALGLLLIGLPSPILWGILAGLLRFVPYVGAILGAVLPVALAAAVDPGWSMMIWTAALFLAIEPFIGHIVEPLAYGHSTGMSPVSVVLAAIFWSWIWGPIGLLLSTPLTLCLVVLGRHIDRLEFLDVILGDRPALTPVENFYQRTLAGDPDEAQEQAELLLKDRSLCSYYDEVAVKGLHLAAADVRRGVVTPQQLERIREAVIDLLEGLQDHTDVEPPPPPPPSQGASRMLRLSNSEQKLPREPSAKLPEPEEIPEPWRQEGAILCVAGRGPLDEISAMLLAQILRKHGLGARVVPHQAASRREIGTLEMTGVRMVCVCSVELQGTPSRLRYLLQRLRRRAPEVPMLAGIWQDDDPALRDDELRRTLGARFLVSSLREAVLACARVAREEFPDGVPPPQASGDSRAVPAEAMARRA